MGAAVGSLFLGPFAKFGKKNGIHATNIILAVGCSLTLVKQVYVIFAGRFMFGLAAGTFSVFVPSFINELTPIELKGPLGSATQLLVNLGILMVNLIELPCSSKPPSEEDMKEFIHAEYWRICFAVPIGLAIVQSILLFTVLNYETPKFLKQNDKQVALLEVMGKLYSAD